MRAARSYVFLFWLIWVALAAALSRGPPGSDKFALAGGLGGVLLPIVCYLWCKADCAARAVRAPPGAVPLMAVLPAIGWAYYLFATRRPLKALTVIVGTLVVALTILGVAKVTLGVAAHVAT